MSKENFLCCAPCGGSVRPGVSVTYFNPRSPVGKQLNCYADDFSCFGFQSTLPMGGATYGDIARVQRALFQSTLPVGGATRICSGILPL